MIILGILFIVVLVIVFGIILFRDHISFTKPEIEVEEDIAWRTHSEEW